MATETTSLAVLLEGTDAIRTSVLLHDRREGPEGAGAEPRIEVYFRLADAPDLGIFKFQTGSWSLASDLAYYGTEDDLADLVADGHKVAATLTLEPVEFVAKSGPQAGKTVSYTKPVLRVGGE